MKKMNTHINDSLMKNGAARARAIGAQKDTRAIGAAKEAGGGAPKEEARAGGRGAPKNMGKGWPPQCLILSDGTMGMLSQCLACAHILGIEAVDLRVMPSPILRIFPLLAKLPGWNLTVGRVPNWLRGGVFPEILITCGRRMAGISMGIKRMSGGATTTIHIQDPHVAPHHFDLLIVPAHDDLAQQNLPNIVVSTGALNRLNMAEIKEKQRLLATGIGGLKKPVTAVMIGGHNKRYKAGRAAFIKLGQQCAAFARAHKTSLVLVTSRRTPQRFLDDLKAELEGIQFVVCGGGAENPYPGVLGLARYIIVTSDSVNMTSEACITGKPVLSAFLKEENGRIAKFHERMQARHHTARLDEVLKNSARLKKPFAILDERAAIAKMILAKIGAKIDLKMGT